VASSQSKAGKASAMKLSPEERRARASAGAQARWAKADPSRAKLPHAICGSTDRPLRVGDLSIPCYVLEDERRVLTVAGISDGMGLARGGSMVAGLNRLELFASRDRVKPYVSSNLTERIANPIVFVTPTGGKAYGYDAEVLVELCEAVLAARTAGILQKQQERIAEQCEKLIRGLARVGIIGMVDEATGYQYIRRRDALHEILAAYISGDLLPWTQRFPEEFYVEIYRLMNWDYLDPRSAKKPSYVGKLTNLLVYDRLPKGVVEELRRLNPVQVETGRRRHKHHQFLTGDIGNPHLEKQITQVLALLRVSDHWREFLTMFRKHIARTRPSDPILITDHSRLEAAGQMPLLLG
jgi:hypothetical protein